MSSVRGSYADDVLELPGKEVCSKLWLSKCPTAHGARQTQIRREDFWLVIFFFFADSMICKMPLFGYLSSNTQVSDNPEQNVQCENSA